MVITKKFKVTEKDIENLMVTALEGGINYWANRCEILTNPKNKECASEAVAYGGQIRIQDDVVDWHILNKEYLLKGIEKAMEHYEYDSFNDFMDDHDAEFADVMIQFTIFDKIIYG